MGLTEIGNTLPPGFRFCPSDEELVFHYLYKKIANEEIVGGTLMEIDLHTCEPWQLPDMAKMNSNEWYFFNFRDRKYSTGFRANRATTSGYWKATGKDKAVFDPVSGVVEGMRKTLVFYKHRAPNGIKTEWIMHEFRMENPHAPPKEDWVLCRIFNKSRGDQSSPQENFYEYDTNSHDNLANSSHTNEHAYAYQNHITTTKLYSFPACSPASTSFDLSVIKSGLIHDDINPQGPKCDDYDYGSFLHEMNFDYSNFAPSNVENNFEDDNHLMFF